MQKEMGIFHKFPLYLGVCCVIIRTKPFFSSQKAANSKEGLFMKRIGMLTSGGDCQALNAAMRGVAKALFNSGEKVEIYGFQDGYQGL